MRSFITVILFSLLIFSCTGKTAISYNDSIIKPQLEIVAYMDSIFTPEVSYKEIADFRQKMMQSAERGLEATKNLEDFQGNESFRDTAVEYFSYVKSYFGETPKMDSILYNFNSPERLELLSDEIYTSTQENFKKFLNLENELLNEQQKFAVEFNLKMDYRQPETP